CSITSANSAVEWTLCRVTLGGPGRLKSSSLQHDSRRGDIMAWSFREALVTMDGPTGAGLRKAGQYLLGGARSSQEDGEQGQHCFVNYSTILQVNLPH